MFYLLKKESIGGFKKGTQIERHKVVVTRRIIKTQHKQQLHDVVCLKEQLKKYTTAAI